VRVPTLDLDGVGKVQRSTAVAAVHDGGELSAVRDRLHEDVVQKVIDNQAYTCTHGYAGAERSEETQETIRRHANTTHGYTLSLAHICMHTHTHSLTLTLTIDINVDTRVFIHTLTHAHTLIRARLQPEHDIIPLVRKSEGQRASS
jgi:hypothetical protein